MVDHSAKVNEINNILQKARDELAKAEAWAKEEIKNLPFVWRGAVSLESGLMKNHPWLFGVACGAIPVAIADLCGLHL